jgi:predicted nuclease of predicted toxin-antitoxin system
MKFVLDMNVSPDLVKGLESAGWTAIHWSQVGDIRAKDSEIFDWAAKQGFIIITHDLDFAVILARMKTAAPSVVQIRDPELLLGMEHLAIDAIKRFESELSKGALISVSAKGPRVRMLPFHG